MKKLGSSGMPAGGGLAGVAILVALAAQARAAPTLAADPMADITDVYAWMTTSNLNLVMDVSALANATQSFGPGVQYVFHLTSKPGLGVGAPGGTETRVICQFASSTSVQCWVTDATGTVTKDYVVGDPSTTGVTSMHGRVKVFAGLRSDPAFFNTSGFAAAAVLVKLIPANPPPDAAGCPQALLADRAQAIRNALMNGPDAFLTTNVMAIVVQIDKALVNVDPNRVVAVWGSTHATP